MIQSFRNFLPAFMWALVIFVIISAPASSLPSTERLNIPHFDKIVHFIIFAILGGLLLWGFLKRKSSKAKGIVLSLTIGILYGVLTEYLQYCCFEDRHGNLADLVANSFGTVFGVFLMMMVGFRRIARKSS